MPGYSIRYVCASPMVSSEPVAMEFDGNSARFTFPTELTANGKLHVTVEVEAEGWNEATITAQRIMQPILDALSFTSGQPILLLNWDFILKDEQGMEKRRALWVHTSQQANTFNLNKASVDEAQQILRKNVPPAIALCWHRYAGHRGYWLDRFVFQWLAFEGLAGDALVTRACDKCGHIHSHQGANRTEALRIFQAANPEITPKEFRDEVWGKDRNTVFHGSKYPGPLHLQRLNELFPKLRRACEVEFSRRYELHARPRPIGQAET